MVIPIITSITREVFAQAPVGREGGGPRPGRQPLVDDPHGRASPTAGAASSAPRCSGSAGRSGETIAVSLLLPQVPRLSMRIFENGGGTISGFIVQRAGSDPITVSALMAAGLVLFVHHARHEPRRLGRHRPQPVGRGGRRCDHHHPTATVDVAERRRRHRLRPAAPVARRVRRRTASVSARLLARPPARPARCLVTWLVFARLTDGTGWLGYLGLCVPALPAVQYVATREQDGAQVAADRLGETVITTGTVAADGARSCC